MEREIRELKRLVGELESGCGFLTQQVRAVHLDSLNFQVLTNNRFDKVDGRCDNVEDRSDRVEGRRGLVETEVASLREGFPTVVGDVMREVLREQKG